MIDFIIRFIEESNDIEGIHRLATADEIQVVQEFLELPYIRIADIEKAVSVFQPNAVLRNRCDLNVRVGDHIPPTGGVEVLDSLNTLLEYVNTDLRNAWFVYCQYEHIHPFTDGNGRSGRLLWLWCMKNLGLPANTGFLKTFHYQTLSAFDTLQDN